MYKFICCKVYMPYLNKKKYWKDIRDIELTILPIHHFF